jgi:probable rRNA maturation factor
MIINIDNEYSGQLKILKEFDIIIQDVVESTCDFMKCPYETEVNVLFTDDETIHQINLENRGIDRPTDVLSFPMIDFEAPADLSGVEDMQYEYFNSDTGCLMLGDIVISIDRAYSQAEEYGHSVKREIAFLTAHSMLHLFGYDHIDDAGREEMEKLQEQILTEKGYTRDYE